LNATISLALEPYDPKFSLGQAQVDSSDSLKQIGTLIMNSSRCGIQRILKPRIFLPASGCNEPSLSLLAIYDSPNLQFRSSDGNVIKSRWNTLNNALSSEGTVL
jgi:hypothetical protein